MLTIRTTEKGIYVSVDGKQEMAHPLGSLRYTCTSTSVRFFPANGYEGLYEGRYGDNFTVNGEPITKENAQTLLEALFFLKDEGGGETLKTINGIAIPGAGNIVLNQYIQHYKWATDAATTRKQVPAVLRAKDVKISYNNASGTYIVEQYQLDDISDAAWGDDTNWKGCRTPLTPMFESAGATFNDETGYYEMNGLTDLTEEEAIKMLQHFTRSARSPYSQLYLSSDCRTFFPLPYVDAPYSWSGSHRNCYNLIYANICKKNPLLLSNGNLMFWNCYKLKEIVQELKFQNTTAFKADNMFKNCRVLETVRITGLFVDLSIAETPVLSLESVTHLVENALIKNAITVTVHPDVYAKLTDEANAEWYAVNTAAQAKQISFATTE